MRIITILILSFLLTACTAAKLFGHEMTPTYPAWMPAFEAPGVMKTNMRMWNRREDISYYEIEVFNKHWEKTPFATQEQVMKVGYLQKKSFTIYIRESDRENVTYICTKSKLIKDSVQSSGVASRICSKIK